MSSIIFQPFIVMTFFTDIDKDAGKRQRRSWSESEERTLTRILSLENEWPRFGAGHAYWEQLSSAVPGRSGKFLVKVKSRAHSTNFKKN